MCLTTKYSPNPDFFLFLFFFYQIMIKLVLLPVLQYLIQTHSSIALNCGKGRSHSTLSLWVIATFWQRSCESQHKDVNGRSALLLTMSATANYLNTKLTKSRKNGLDKRQNRSKCKSIMCLSSPPPPPVCTFVKIFLPLQ